MAPFFSARICSARAASRAATSGLGVSSVADHAALHEDNTSFDGPPALVEGVGGTGRSGGSSGSLVAADSAGASLDRGRLRVMALANSGSSRVNDGCVQSVAEILLNECACSERVSDAYDEWPKNFGITSRASRSGLETQTLSPASDQPMQACPADTISWKREPKVGTKGMMWQGGWRLPLRARAAARPGQHHSRNSLATDLDGGMRSLRTQAGILFLIPHPPFPRAGTADTPLPPLLHAASPLGPKV
eukprot:scaffold1342_cov120-Isochrysis_galbana.AAC.5